MNHRSPGHPPGEATGRPRAVVAFPPNRKMYELCYFNDMKRVEVTALFPGEAPKGARSGVRVLAPGVKRAPCPLGSLRWISGPVAYESKEALDGADYLVSLELFSFLSKQMAAVADRTSARHIVIVEENIASHPFYWLPFFRRNREAVRRSASMFVPVSDKSADHLRQLGIEDERIRRIYLGVDTSAFRPNGNQRAEGRPRILFVGALSAHKGFDLVMKAFEIARKGLDAELWVAGDGPLRRLLHEPARPSVRYLGNVGRGSLPDVYRQCDVFVSLPKVVRRMGVKMWEEQFGFSTVEALASGLPVIGSDCGAVKEIVGSNNIVLEDPTPEKVAEAFRTILSDDGLARRMGAENRKRAELLFDEKAQSIAFEDLVLSL